MADDGASSDGNVRDPESEREPAVLRLRVGGMHCPNCPIAVERALRAVPGVRKVEVDLRSGRALIEHIGGFDMATLQDAVVDEGYTLGPWQGSDQPAASGPANSPRDYAEIGAAFVILVAIALLFQRFDLLPRGFAISDNMSYGLAFLIGLVASVSTCIAVTGGLLVAVAARYNDAHAHLTDAQRLKPHLYFNAGRIVSYTLLGGAVGALGSALTLSPRANGILTIAASAVMIVLGLQMLRLGPSLARLLPAMPKAFTHRIHDFAERETTGAAFLLGASTFFLPCGFTQALQLYVLAKGSVLTGALTMLAFALGTLPALLSLSAVASLAKGAFQRHFLRLAGAAVILLGIVNVQYGLVLGGSGMASLGDDTAPRTSQVILSQLAEPAGDTQRISMRVVGLDYVPHRFIVKQGVPVEWRIDASEAASCGRFLIAPGLRVRKLLSNMSTTLITFTPMQAGEFGFNCGMGMMTLDAKITVVAKAKG
jgi:sulfite exporter TauE/SafE/copper chaperone CopZ